MIARPRSATVSAVETSTVETQGVRRLSGIATPAPHALKLTAEAIRKPLISTLDLIDRTLLLLLFGADDGGLRGDGIKGVHHDAGLAALCLGTVGTGGLIGQGGPEPGEADGDRYGHLDLPGEAGEEGQERSHRHSLRRMTNTATANTMAAA
jgi:hypothetical protein